MKLLLGWVLACCAPLWAGEFALDGRFDSPKAFVDAAKGFEPVKHPGKMAALLAFLEINGDGSPQTVQATKVESAAVLWKCEDESVVMVETKPPTEGSRSAVCVLFILRQAGKAWSIQGHQRFTGYGKYAGVSAGLTTEWGTVSNAEEEGGKDPVFTVVESHGGRGKSYQVSGSFKLAKSGFVRMELGSAEDEWTKNVSRRKEMELADRGRAETPRQFASRFYRSLARLKISGIPDAEKRAELRPFLKSEWLDLLEASLAKAEEQAREDSGEKSALPEGDIFTGNSEGFTYFAIGKAVVKGSAASVEIHLEHVDPGSKKSYPWTDTLMLRRDCGSWEIADIDTHHVGSLEKELQGLSQPLKP
ncbi:MAG: hypothetical protein QM755_14215 [Luteolibacter sp.]